MNAGLCLLFALLLPFAGHADLLLDPPEQLVERASESKHHLRDVINQLDQQLTEMRDVRTFNRYFYTLDRLQALSEQLQLDTIYPNAVKKLGSRMVQKGVNWLDVIDSPREDIMYYHKWMEPASAFSFLYAAELRAKEEKSLDRLSTAAENLEAAMEYADQRWANERSLRLVYRATLSQISAQAVARNDLNNEQIVFWIGNIYSSESMSEILTNLQHDLYLIHTDTKERVHTILLKLTAIQAQVSKPSFGSSESLVNQLGDAVADLVVKSLTFEEKLSDEEFTKALAALRPRHASSLGQAWAGLTKTPRGDFSGYYVRKAFAFIKVLEEQGLDNEADSLSRNISARAAAIMGREDKIEGTWIMKSQSGKTYRLVVAYAMEDFLIAGLSDTNDITRRALYRVVYDIHAGGYIAMTRDLDMDSDPNLGVRFVPQDDGTLEVQDLSGLDSKRMTAIKRQTFDDDFSKLPEEPKKDSEGGPTFNGYYKGTFEFPSGRVLPVSLRITQVNGGAVGHLRYGGPDPGMWSFNFGTDDNNGFMYLTRGHGNDSNAGGGVWLQLRLYMKKNGDIRGHNVFGYYGMVKNGLKLQRVDEE